jgi:hypothetical protein
MDDTTSKAGLGASLLLILGFLGDLWKRRNSSRAIRSEIHELKEVAEDNQLAIVGIAAKMVTKDDLAALTEKFSTLQREQANTITDALQAGLQHAHERIDTLYEKRA